MKKINVKLIGRLFVLLVSIFLLDLSASYAQIGQLGIYGSVAEADRSRVRFVRLEDYPELDGGLVYLLPVNGLTNFNFYYKPDGSGFLPGGNYKITYLNGTLNKSYGTDIVNYSPNAGHTNGVQVRAFNNPPSTPRGIHGTILAQIPNGGGATAPLENAMLFATPLGLSISVLGRTNANGYFSIYYTNGDFGQFLPAIDHWGLLISGTLNGCVYQKIYNASDIFWYPDNPTDPTLSNYYVGNAEADIGTPILTSTASGCQP